MCGVHDVDLSPLRKSFSALSVIGTGKEWMWIKQTNKKTELKIMFHWDMLLNHVKITSMSIPVSL